MSIIVDTNNYASIIDEQQRRREQARTEAQRKQDVKMSDDARKALQIERIQKPEPIA